VPADPRAKRLSALPGGLARRGHEAAIPRGRSVAVLDIGMGANCIYPLIGASEYGWRFVGSEIDPVAFSWARKLVAANRAVADLIECRLQTSR
jgi:23S rRNA (adenine1618-N6)-methyltransferase